MTVLLRRQERWKGCVALTGLLPAQEHMGFELRGREDHDGHRNQRCH